MSDPAAPANPAAPFDMPAVSAGFDKRAGWVVNRLMVDLQLTREQASGIVGNLGGESGLEAIQERHPLAGAGGFGWEQATGPRRGAFYRFAADENLQVTDDKANYDFLLHELAGSEAHALEQLRKCVSLEAATETFCVDFERPADPKGTLPSRMRWAQRAYTASQPAAQASGAADLDHSADALNAAELARLSAAAPAAQPAPAPAPAPTGGLTTGSSVVIGSGTAAMLVKPMLWISAMIAAHRFIPLDESTASAIAAGAVMWFGWRAHKSVAG